MAQFCPNPQSLSRVRGKVVVLSGGANGIGAATTQLLYEQGANVVFGDLDQVAGNKLVQQLTSDSLPRAHFLKTDVTNYQSLLALFEFAFEKYGRIDHALPFAGIVEIGNWFDPSLDLSSIKMTPNTLVLDVNLLGTLYFARIAAVYLRQGAQPGDDKSLVLMSSAAGFKETPGMFLYQATKHGTLGLLRSLRLYLPKESGIRVNAVLPWMTDTGMVAGFAAAWKRENLPVNTPLDVAGMALGVACESTMNGKGIYVEGGRGWEIEDNISRLEPQWLGEEPSKTLAKGQQLLGIGSSWTAPQQNHTSWTH